MGHRRWHLPEATPRRSASPCGVVFVAAKFSVGRTVSTLVVMSSTGFMVNVKTCASTRSQLGWLLHNSLTPLVVGYSPVG